MAGVVLACRHGAPKDARSLDLSRYITEEVLDKLPEDEQRFILDTSILDTVSLDGVQALLGWEGRQLWERVRTRHIPATTVTSRSIQYHSMLKEVLRAELVRRDASREAMLTQRYAEHLVTVHHVEEATELFLQLDDPDRAAEVAEEALPTLYGRADWATLDRWLDRLGHARVDDRPRLLAARIRSLYGLRRFEQVTALIRRLDQLGQLRAATEADHGLLATMGWALQADPSESQRLIDRYPGDFRVEAVRFMLDTYTGVSAATPPQVSDWGEFERLVSWSCLLQGRLDQVSAMIPAAEDVPITNPNLLLVPLWEGDTAKARALWERVPHEIRERPQSLFIEACLLLATEDHESALAALQAAVTASRKTGFPMDSFYEIMAGLVLLLTGQRADGIDLLERRMVVVGREGHLAMVEWCQTFLGLGFLLVGRSRDAQLLMQECVRSMRRAGRRLLLPLAACLLSEAEAREGDLDAAHEAAGLALDTAETTKGCFWLDLGMRLFPSLAQRELEANPGNTRWQELGRPAAAATQPEAHVRPRQIVRLYLQPFGRSPNLFVDDEPRPSGRLKLLELVGLLTQHPRGINRDLLQERLFPDSDQRRGGNHFRQIAHKLRESTGVSLARFGGDTVTWPSDVEVAAGDIRLA